MVPSLDSKTQVNRYVGWLVAARMALASLWLAASSASVFIYSSSPDALQSVFEPIIAVFLFSALSVVYLHLVRPGDWFAWFQLLADSLIVTVLIYATGGAISPFLFLYLPHVMSAAIIFSRRRALIVAAIDFAVYSLLVYALVYRQVPGDAAAAMLQIPSGGVTLQLVGLASAMVLVGVATSYLARRLRLSDQMMQQSQQDLADLDARQKQLIDGLPAALITTDLEDAILNINQAASDLFKIGQAECSGKKLSELMKECELEPRTALQQNEAEVSFKMTDGRTIKAQFSAQDIKSEKGESKGKVLAFRDITKLKYLENKLELHEKMARLLAAPHDLTPARTVLPEFVGGSLVMQKVFRLIERVAQSDATVLIDGESGTGKELVARAVHFGGARAKGPFIPVNCGAIPENLIESELFGHKKGAFTGAEFDHVGLFRRAEGGTIFLDEIGELPLHMQSKLLRALQEKMVRPVGSERDFPINLRILAATNKNLKRCVEQGTFREDLFYRLNVIHVMLPPLRERGDDLPLLINSILKRLAKGGPAPMVTPAAMELLLSYHYPGNVRELENILERAVVLGGDVILPEHFPESVRQRGNLANPFPPKETQIIIDENISFPVKLDEILDSIERKYIELALAQTQGAKKRAANLLGINFRSLRYRLQKYGFNAEEERE